LGWWEGRGTGLQGFVALEGEEEVGVEEVDEEVEGGEEEAVVCEVFLEYGLGVLALADE